MKPPILTPEAFIPPLGTPPLVHLSNFLKGTGVLVLPCSVNPTGYKNAISNVVRGNRALLPSEFRLGGTQAHPALLPKYNHRYRAIIFVYGARGVYAEDNACFRGQGWVNHSLLYNSNYGQLIAVGPLVLASQFPVLNSGKIHQRTLDCWNRVLKHVTTVGNPNNANTIIRKLLRSKVMHGDIVELKYANKENLKYMRAQLSLEYEKIKQLRVNLAEAKVKRSIWSTVRQANTMLGLRHAKEQGIIKSYRKVMGSVEIIFDKRKMLLPLYEESDDHMAYPGGIYEFPEMVLLVHANGADCQMMTLDGKVYPHPHAEIGGATDPPCWDEVVGWDAKEGDPFSQLSNSNKVKLLWYSDPLGYCQFIKAYLNDMWDRDESDYAPLHSYGKIIEVREEVPEPLPPIPHRDSEFYHANSAVFPVPDCVICAYDETPCTCACTGCCRVRSDYISSHPNAFQNWLETE